MGNKTKVLAINPSIELHERIEALIERGGGHLSKRGLSIIALKHGLDLYERALDNVESMLSSQAQVAELGRTHPLYFGID